MAEGHLHVELDGVQQLHHHVAHVAEGQLAAVLGPQGAADLQGVHQKGLGDESSKKKRGGGEKRVEVVPKKKKIINGGGGGGGWCEKKGRSCAKKKYQL